MNSFARICIAMLAVTCLGAFAPAADINWTGLGLSNDFSDLGNWSLPFPGTADGNTRLVLGSYTLPDTTVVNTYTVDFTTPPPTIGQLLVGNGAEVTMNLANQNLTSNSWVIVGWANGDLGITTGIATLNISGTSVLTHNNDGNIVVGEGTGRIGTINVSGSAVINNNNSDILVGYNGGEGTLTIADNANVYNNRYWTCIGRNGTGHVIQTGGTFTSITNGWDGNIHIGEWGGYGDWTMTGGKLECGGGNFSIGEDGTGTLSITGNSTVSTTRGEFWVGNGGSGTGTMYIGNGTDNPTLTVNNWFCTGRQTGSHGTVIMQSGTVTKTGGGNFLIGDWGTGSWTITGNSTLSVNNEFWVGQGGNGNGTLTVGDGTDNPTINIGSWMSVGRDGGNGTVVLNSGTINKTGAGSHLSLAGWWLNGTNGATWTQNGGTLNVATDILCGENGNAVFTLNGGSVKANIIRRLGSGISEFHYNGGTVELIGAGTIDNGGVQVPNNVVNVDKNYVEIGGANLVLQKDIVFSTGFKAGLGGSGGLTKSGPGNLILTASSNYTGPTHVTGGGLVVGNDFTNFPVLTSDVTLDSTATLLAGNGTIGDATTGVVALGQGVTLSAGELGKAGNLTIAQSLSLNANILNVNVDAGFASSVIIQNPATYAYGTLSAAGTTVITPTQVGSGIYAGSYPIFQFGSFASGGLNNFVLALDSVGPCDAALELTNNGSYELLNLVLSYSTNEWFPTNGTNYSTALPHNWSDGTIPNAPGAKALFGSNYGTGGPVNLNINATVGKIVFDNMSASYTISSNNGSKFTFVPSVLNAAINDVNGSHEIAVPLVTTKPLVVTVANAGDTLTLSGAIGQSGGSYGVTKGGSGSLTLTGANTYTGATTFNNGTLTINSLAPAGSASSIGAASADAANFKIGNATLAYIGGTTATNRGITVTGPLTLNVQNATPATVTLSGSILNPASPLAITGNGSVAFTNSGVNTLAGTDPVTARGGVAIDNNNVIFDGGVDSVYNVGGVYNPTADGNDRFTVGVGSNGSTGALTLKSGTLNVNDGYFTVASGVGTGGPSVGTFTMTGGTLNVLTGEIAFGNNGGKATIVQSGGTITAHNYVGVGRHWPDTVDVGTDTTYTMTGGVIHKYAGGGFEVGERGHVDVNGNIDVYGHGTLDMSGNAQVIVDAGDLKIGVALGAIGKVTVKDNASITHSNDNFCIGVDGGVGELDLTSGTISAREIWVGQYFSNITMPDTTVVRVPGKGTFNMSGGTVNLKGWFPVGRDRGQGTFTMTGGTFNKTVAAGSGWGNVIVGSVGGDGVFNMNGGVFNNNSQLILGEVNGTDLSTGVFNLNGGTMQASAVRQLQSTATGTLNFNGGVLQVSDMTGNTEYNWNNSPNPIWLHSRYIATTNAVVQAGGAKIDTNGYTIGVNQTLTSGAAADGGLTKQGTGSLYLSATPAYNGVTTVSNGSLVLDRANLPGAVQVAAGGTLRLSNPSGLTGTYYNGILPNNSMFNSVSELNTYFATQTPTATHNTIEAGSFLDMGSDGQYFPAPFNAGAVDFQTIWTGMFHAATDGTYNFATASDDGSMLFLDGNTVVNNNGWQGVTRKTGSVYLTAGDHPITVAFYQGGGGYGMWAEVQQPGQQWQYLANDMLSNTSTPLTAQAFSIGSLAGAGGTVDLGGALNTLTINQAADGTFAGVIVGSGALVKDGPATLTLTQDIAYTGDTVVNNGIMVAQNMTTSANISVLGTAELSATSIVTGTLTIGGTPIVSQANAAVPEPGTLVLLALASLALAGGYLRRK